MTYLLILQVLGVFLMFGPGFWLRRRGRLSEGGTSEMAHFLVLAAYPCLIFSSVVMNYSFGEMVAAWPLPLSVFLLYLLGFGVGRGVSRLARFRSVEQQRSFLFQCTVNNYAFLPMPIVLLLYGEKGVATLVLSALGAELALWSIGVSILNGRRFGRGALRSLLTPPLQALLAALVVVAVRDCTPAGAGIHAFVNCKPGELLVHTLKVFGAMTIPLAMTVAGSSLAHLRLGELQNPLVWLAGGVRLVVVPLLALGVLAVAPLSMESRHVLSVVAVMPVSVASVTFSRMFHGDDHFVAGSVLLTHLLALITVPLLLGWCL